MRLLPGVRYENTVDSLGMSFGTSVPNVGGARRDWSNVIVDGVVGNEVGNSGLMAQQINLDAIAEVRVLLNSYRAEYGRAGGGQVQIVSKSGTSTYHGNVYYYLRNEALNANNFFNNRSNIKKPRYRFNTFGANLGGPVPGNKDDKKLFFFYSLEAPLVNRPGPVRNWTMPTDREMQGDFSQTLDAQGRLIYIRDPLRERRRATPSRAGPAASRATSSRRTGINSNGTGAAEHAPAREQLRPHVHAGAVQLHDAGERRQPEDEQRRPRGLAADLARQLLLHVQGLVLGPARQRDHRRAGEVGILQHALPEHRPRRQRELREDPQLEPRARARLRHPAADRAVLSAHRGGLGRGSIATRRLHRRPVPSRAEPAQRHPESHLQRAQMRRTSPSTTGWSIRAKPG